MLLYPDAKNQRILTEYGYSLVDVDRMASLILENEGEVPKGFFIEEEEEAESFRQLFNIDIHSARYLAHYEWSADIGWNMETDLDEFIRILSDDPRVDSEEKKKRIERELVYFNEIGFLYAGIAPLVELISEFEEDGVVWGVGRGSMCASYVFYLWGITDIDPMEYDIPFSELSKEIDE